MFMISNMKDQHMTLSKLQICDYCTKQVSVYTNKTPNTEVTGKNLRTYFFSFFLMHLNTSAVTGIN